ncbi:hypothetical protein OZK63_40990, partial [Streptomyces sp. UMAF16]|nr:hypothetical protein [Streptomyces sp. UMAF16]
IEDLLEEDAGLAHSLFKNSAAAFVLVDRMIVKSFEEEDIHRLSDSILTAFYEGEGEMFVEVNEVTLLHFSNKFELDGIVFEEPVPNLFSF